METTRNRWPGTAVLVVLRRWMLMVGVIGLATLVLAGSLVSAAPADLSGARPDQRPPAGQVPALVHFQGRLTDASGKGIADGEHTLVFRLYPSGEGGSAVWTETQRLAVEDGAFNVLLGQVTDLLPAVSFHGALWLGIQVDGASELSPRYPLTASPFALRSGDADALRGLGPEAFSAAAHDHDARYVNVDGDQMASDRPRTPVLDVVHQGNGFAVQGHSVGNIGLFGSSGEGSGLLGSSGSVGVYGSGEVTGVTGAGRVTGVVGKATGTSAAATGVLGEGLIGVWGRSEHGSGLHGEGGQYGVYARSTEGMAVFGQVEGRAPAILGRSDGTGGFGVEGSAVLGTGVIGRGEMGLVGEGSVGPGVRGTGVVGVWGNTRIGAGVHGETEGMNMPGVEGYSDTGPGVSGRGANGVKGESNLDLGGTGVWGVSSGGTGVFGEGGRAGVHGEGPHWGVYAKSAEGVGLMAESRSGVALMVAGEAAQTLADDGLVKAAAMVWCDMDNPKTYRAFSNVHGMGGEVAPVTLIRGKQAGDCSIDFGFDLSQRFVQATSLTTSAAREAVGVTVRSTDAGGASVLGFFRWDKDGRGVAGPIYVLVY